MTSRSTVPQRVALFDDSVAFGGVEVHILLVLEHLDRQRFEPFVLLPGLRAPWAANPPRFVELAGTLGVPFLQPPDPGVRPVLGAIREVRAIARLLRSNRIDILHIHTSQPARARRQMLAARLAGVRAIIRTEHLPPTIYGRGRAERAVIPLFDRLVRRFIVVSEQNRGEQISFGRSARKLLLIRNGIDVKRFVDDPSTRSTETRAALGVAPDAFVVGAVGRLSHQKSLGTLLDAVGLLATSHPEVVVVLAGEGGDEQSLRQRAADLGIADRVVFAGHVDDPRALISEIDVIVMPSIFEGLPLALLESMSLARPCVVSDLPNMIEAVGDDGTCGLVARVGDPASFASAIGRLLDEPGLAERIGRNARDRALSEFDIRRQVVELMSVYDGLAAQRDRA